MELEFIKNISESRIFNNKVEINEVDRSSLSNLLMAYSLGLHVLRSERISLREYIEQTLLFEDFNSFRQTGNDLYVLLNAIAERNTRFNPSMFKTYLKVIHEGKSVESFVEKYFLRLETELLVEDKDLKKIRRLATRYDSLKAKDRLQVIEGIITYIRNLSKQESKMLKLLGEGRMRAAEFLTEEVTMQELRVLEKYLDRLYAQDNIDFEFTRHFVERVNDPRNIVPISIGELSKMFSDAQKRYGRAFAKLRRGAEAVITDMETDINSPFVIGHDPKTGMLELIAKTVMRKKGFKTPNKKFVTY